MSLYRLSVTRLPAIIKGLHTTSTTTCCVVDEANSKSNTEHLNPFSLVFLSFCLLVVVHR